MPSFDVVSKVSDFEVENACNQAQKEILQRYDFRGTGTDLEQTPEGIMLCSSTEDHMQAAFKVLMERLSKRGVSLRAVEPGDITPAGKNTFRQLVKIKQGIETEKGKELIRKIKDSKLKVQSQIQDEQVRVTGKSRDELQRTIALLRSADVGIDLQFENFRD